MKISEISQYEKSVLVNAVKLSQRKQLLTGKGGWKEWLQVSLQAQTLQYTTQCGKRNCYIWARALGVVFGGSSSSSAGNMSCTR
jgi:hypothetical protein